MKNTKFQTIILFILILVLSLVALFSFFYHQVSKDASSGIERGAINNIIFSESPVYYDDGENVIGVFFEKTHRNYIQYKGIPPFFIKAIIASEDRNFFDHNGFDMKAILRAFIANIKAGKTVQGGSTITQQTAKNIFKRQKRSYRAKLKELVQALLLEKKYTKEEILEMYVNQFFVTGFGRGLEIAAQYFFDKGAEDLDLVESAFIAGSVKGPYLYNPFTKKSNAERIRALQLAKERKDYVLGNMVKLQFITKAQYLEGKAREVPFKEGRVTYRLNVIMNYIREQLESPYFRKILEDSDPQPIIILQGDHGPGAFVDWDQPNNTDFRERFSILNAYYLPGIGSSMLYPSISPVNSFRVLLNEALGSEFQLLDDTSYFSTITDISNFVDVTRQLGPQIPGDG